MIDTPYGLMRTEVSLKKPDLVKYHGASNDFFFASVSFSKLQKASTLAEVRDWVRELCHRQTGLGADGVVVVEQQDDGAFEALILNADGSIAATCGNALRCLSQFVQEYWSLDVEFDVWRPSLTTKWANELKADESFAQKIEVFARCSVWQCENKLLGYGSCSIEMGSQKKIEVVETLNCARIFWELGFKLSEADLKVHFVELQNPHIVLAHPEFKEFVKSDFDALGKALQTLLPARLGLPFSNIGFLWPDGDHFGLIVYERGAGLTTGCGSGATAAFGAIEFLAQKLGELSLKSREFKMPGGVLEVSGSIEARVLRGPSQKVAAIYLDQFRVESPDRDTLK